LGIAKLVSISPLIYPIMV